MSPAVDARTESGGMIAGEREKDRVGWMGGGMKGGREGGREEGRREGEWEGERESGKER